MLKIPQNMAELGYTPTRTTPACSITAPRCLGHCVTKPLTVFKQWRTRIRFLCDKDYSGSFMENCIGLDGARVEVGRSRGKLLQESQ